MQPINLDANPDNADWTKRYAWDLQIDDLAGLREYLLQRAMTVAQFKQLQVYAVNQYLHPWLQTIPDDLLDPYWKPPAPQAPPGGGRTTSTVTTRKRS